MKNCTAFIVSAIMALLLNSVVYAQEAGFNQRNPAFTAPGPGNPEFVYHFVVPPGVTIETPKGKVVNAGETIGIPGKYLKLMTPEKAQAMIEREEGFNQKDQLTRIKPSEKQNWAVIELTVPKGATITRSDGYEVKGPQTVMLMVEAASMLISKEDTNKEEMHAVGGFTQKY
jgi:hypothetical protein